MQSKINKKSILNEDVILSNFVVGYFVIQAFNFYIKIVLGGLPYWSFLSKGILAIFLIFSLKPIMKRGAKKAIIIELSFIVMAIYTIAAGNAGIQEYISIYAKLIVVYVPMGIAVYLIKDKSVLLQRLYYASWIIQALLIMVLLNFGDETYSMPGGYALAFQVLILIDHFFEERKWYDFVAIVFDSVAIIMFGSRGPIVCIAAMVLIKLMFHSRMSKRKRVIISGIIVFALLFFLLTYQYLFSVLIKIANKFGIYSRTLEMFNEKILFSDSGRLRIIKRYLEKIKENPIFGYGLAGGWTGTGMYPHNLFIELLLSFGLIVGGVLSVFIVIIGIRGIIQKEISLRRIAQISFAYCVTLLISDSFVYSPIFYIMIATCIETTIHLTSKEHNSGITYNKFRKFN